jgi:hypothetical protein
VKVLVKSKIESWKNIWKQKNLKRYKKLHPIRETIYKRFMSIQPKVISDQFVEAINLTDNPIELMDFSAAIPELTCTKLYKTGKKVMIQLLIFIYQVKIFIITQKVRKQP